MRSGEKSVRKTYESKIVCPHCSERITIRGHLMDRTIPDAVDKAFVSVKATFDSLDKTFRELFR